MTATLYTLPMSTRLERQYVPTLLGRRVQHALLLVRGRLTGEVRYGRGETWFEVDTNDGTHWWIAGNTLTLGPIAMPCPKGERLA